MATHKGKYITMLSRISGVPRDQVKAVMDAMPEVMAEALLNGDSIWFPNLFTLELGTRKARNARNPVTGEIEQFPEVKTVRCKISGAIKAAINGKAER